MLRATTIRHEKKIEAIRTGRIGSSKKKVGPNLAGVINLFNVLRVLEQLIAL
ncbi:MAG TPA: hypothetical protein VMU16_10315 [Candidatus Binataceae bacterium]|nr:hypothetical protein [Candidatus Binataceae bacterium]